MMILAATALFLYDRNIRPVLGQARPPGFFFCSFLIMVFCVSFGDVFGLFGAMVYDSVVRFLLWCSGRVFRREIVVAVPFPERALGCFIFFGGEKVYARLVYPASI